MRGLGTIDGDINEWAKTVGTGIERLLALGILVGAGVFAYGSTLALAQMDWRASETFYELIYRVLALVIAIELARTLVTHDLSVILELLAFVIARKMLKPELSAVEILLATTAFVALVAARRYFLPTAK